MHRKTNLQNKELFAKIKELSNPSKFKIIETLQTQTLTITDLAKKVNLAFNKCSNYCSDLEKQNLITKQKQNKNTLVQTPINLTTLTQTLQK